MCRLVYCPSLCKYSAVLPLRRVPGAAPPSPHPGRTTAFAPGSGWGDGSNSARGEPPEADGKGAVSRRAKDCREGTDVHSAAPPEVQARGSRPTQAPSELALREDWLTGPETAAADRSRTATVSTTPGSWLLVTGYRLPATGYRLPATGYRRWIPTSCPHRRTQNTERGTQNAEARPRTKTGAGTRHEGKGRHGNRHRGCGRTGGSAARGGRPSLRRFRPPVQLPRRPPTRPRRPPHGPALPALRPRRA